MSDHGKIPPPPPLPLGERETVPTKSHQNRGEVAFEIKVANSGTYFLPHLGLGKSYSFSGCVIKAAFVQFKDICQRETASDMIVSQFLSE